MVGYLGNKMHAPQARISKANSEDDSERSSVSVSVDSCPPKGSRLTITSCEPLDPQDNIQ